MAGVAEAEECCDAGRVLGVGPELAGGRAAEDGAPVDFVACDEVAERGEGHPGLERTLRIADEPRAHGVL